MEGNMTPQTTPNTILYIRDPEVVARLVGEEMVLVPVRRQVSGPESIYTLNAVGAFVWQRLAVSVTRDALVEAVCGEFEITAEQAAVDVERFLQELRQLNLISTSLP